jgi:hypothetical protein
MQLGRPEGLNCDFEDVITCVLNHGVCVTSSGMPGKTQQLQIRVTPQQKAALKRQAAAAGHDVSGYVLSRLLPPERQRFAELVASLDSPDYRFALAELNDFLSGCPPMVFRDAVAEAAFGALSSFLQNYLAAMVEQAAEAKQIAPPEWVRRIAPLDSLCDPDGESAPAPAAVSAGALQAPEHLRGQWDRGPGLTVSAPHQLTTADVLGLFELLNEELAATETHAELNLVGWAVMCLALGARAATRDVDGWFQPVARVREAAARVAMRAAVPEGWLDDAVKAWLSPRGTFDRYLERSHLQVYVAQPEYLLAMKCLALRLGEEYHDLEDVRYLLRYLNITRAADALAIVTAYFAEEQVPTKTRLALEELLPV